MDQARGLVTRSCHYFSFGGIALFAFSLNAHGEDKSLISIVTFYRDVIMNLFLYLP